MLTIGCGAGPPIGWTPPSSSRLHVLYFVLHEALEGDVNNSLNLDSHGKSWNYLLLGLDIDIDDAVQSPPFENPI